MANNAAETLIGAAVLVVAVGFVTYAMQSTGFGPQGGDRYELHANFNSAEGVSVGTDVRMAGVKIGAVNALDLNPETYQANARFTITNEILIPDDSDVKVASEGLLGGNFIEITPGGSAFMLADGDEILLTQSAVSVLNLLLKFVADGAAEE